MATKRLADLITIAARITRISAAQIIGQQRNRYLCEIRFAIIRVGHEYGYSSPQLGRALGDRDHSTILHGIGKGQILSERRPDFNDLVDQIRRTAENSDPFIMPPSLTGLKWKPGPPPVIRAPAIRPRLIRDDHDAAHAFHEGIARGSAKLLAALQAA